MEASYESDDLMVDAEPERSLFVEMLTRDIELIPAIMDLIDNSIDGARAMIYGAEATPADFRIDLSVSEKAFQITDNCGGIDLDVALKYAFRFGRPDKYEGTRGSVGQFGVGMKRALFKLGNRFLVDSRAETTQFSLNVNVDAWKHEESGSPWTFKMQSSSRTYDSAKGGRGTTIRVSGLHDSVAEDFGSQPFLSQLREQIRFRHQGALADGIVVSLNGDVLDGLVVELLSGPQFEPINRAFVVPSPYGDVAVRITAGITNVQRREIGRDDTDAENFRGGSDAGWWVFCNGRLLLMRDRSRLTGWGVNLPNYHPQYRQFRGYVYLSAESTAALPWNTTKTGVDEDSRVWRMVQAQIKLAGSEVVAVLNRLKAEERTAISAADMPTVTAANASRLTPTSDLPERERFVVPPIPVAPKTPRPKQPQMRKLQFEVPVERFGLVAAKLGTEVVAEVGRRTFDYYFEREVEE